MSCKARPSQTWTTEASPKKPLATRNVSNSSAPDGGPVLFLLAYRVAIVFLRFISRFSTTSSLLLRLGNRDKHYICVFLLIYYTSHFAEAGQPRVMRDFMRFSCSIWQQAFSRKQPSKTHKGLTSGSASFLTASTVL